MKTFDQWQECIKSAAGALKAAGIIHYKDSGKLVVADEDLAKAKEVVAKGAEDTNDVRFLKGGMAASAK